MKISRIVLLALLIPLFWEPALTNPDTPEKGTIDLELAAQYFSEANAAFQKDSGRLWGRSLAGAMMFVEPKTRQIVTNMADTQGRLKKQGNVFVGTLPETILTANTSKEWAGVTWAMLIWPLSENKHDRAALMAHESWHRIQEEIGFLGSEPENAHLDTKNGRIWIQLEWRALALALAAGESTREIAIQDALIFRSYRRTFFDRAAQEEVAMEMHEGLAEYTGLRLSGRDAAQQRSHLAKELLERPQRLPTFVSLFAYLTGPAYGLLLDEAAPDWRSGLNTSDDLGALLANAVGFEIPNDLEEAVGNRIERYDGATVISAEEEREKKQKTQIAKYRKQLVEGPVLVLPLKRVKISFDPSSQVPLEAYGRVYPKITIKDVWGVITVTNGALISFKEMRGAVMIEADQNEHPLTSDGWTLSLEEGWAVVPGEREGDLTIKKTDKYMAKDVYERVKLLASSEGELIWPGFDPSRYTELRRDESDGTSYLALSNELEKPDPEFMITINDRVTQKQSLAANLNLVFHEAFHCFQHDSERIGVEWGRESPRVIFRYGAMTANNFTRFCIEAQLLWDALFAPDDESCRTAARQFIAVRRHRQAQMAPELVEFEKGAEVNEGIATYVGVQAVKIAIKAQDQGRLNLSLCESHPEKWVCSKLSSLEEMHELARDIRRRFYHTGAAQAFILDRLSPGWKRRVQTEAAVLQNLIAEVLDAEEENDASIAEDVIIQKGFNTLLKKIMDLQEKAMIKNRETADSILNFNGWKIIIDLEEFGHLASQINFAPNRVIIIDGHTRVHEIFLRIWEEGSFQALFNKPVIEDEAALRYCSHAEPGEIPVVILDGKNLSLDRPGRFPVKKEATVSADRISLTMEAGTIIIKDKTALLHVTTKKNN